MTNRNDISNICEILFSLQKQRRFVIKQQLRMNQSTDGFIVSWINRIIPDKSRSLKQAYNLARKYRKSIEKTLGNSKTILEKVEQLLPLYDSGFSDYIMMNFSTRKPWDIQRKNIEAEMTRVVEDLPVFPFVSSISGVSNLGLAVVVGEAGDLTKYETFAKLQTRLGVGCRDGRRQGDPVDSKNPEEWVRHQYNPERRAEIWAFFSDSMIRSQRLHGQDNGRYGAIYSWKKSKYLSEARGWTLAHIDNAARRYASQKFLRDLWYNWKLTYPQN